MKKIVLFSSFSLNNILIILVVFPSWLFDLHRIIVRSQSYEPITIKTTIAKTSIFTIKKMWSISPHTMAIQTKKKSNSYTHSSIHTHTLNYTHFIHIWQQVLSLWIIIKKILYRHTHTHSETLNGADSYEHIEKVCQNKEEKNR